MIKILRTVLKYAVIVIEVIKTILDNSNSNKLLKDK